jgi:GT2 family glycosyltransferase
MKPLISIVMLCWNRRDDVRESLKRVQEIEYDPLEIIVVDNGSSDGTTVMIENEFPLVKLIRMYKNMGIEAYNIGFENARGEFIIIIDDDSFPAKDALEKMVERFQDDPKLGVVAFDVRNYYHYDEVKQMMNSFNAAKARASGNYYMAFNGAGAGIRAQLFKQVGYYPEEFFLYNNELDTAYRIWDAGYTIKSFPDIVAYHKYSPKNRESWRAPYYYVRNAFWVVWKNYPIKHAVRQTIKLVHQCIYASLEQSTTVYLKAMYSAFVNAAHLKGKRKAVKKEIVENLRVSFDVFFTFYR